MVVIMTTGILRTSGSFFIQRIQLTDGFQGMVGRDVLMTELFDNLREASSCDYPVLIHGESGTGKELAAAAVHDLSARATRRFVPVNCGVLVGELFESDLFGHVKGAFTGAVSDKKGRVAVADGGTFFLDEVSELSPATQAKFLRFLQEGTYERVGDEKTSTVDVRVISATNRDLEKEVAAGRFREDLYFRLSTIPVRVPPLRERRGDIALLVGHIVKQASEKMGREPVPVTPGAMALLTACEWPGNVRELENAVTFALIRSRGDAIDVGHLPAGVGGKGTAPAPLRRPKQKASDEAIRAALEKTGGEHVRRRETAWDLASDPVPSLPHIHLNPGKTLRRHRGTAPSRQRRDPSGRRCPRSGTD